MFTLEADWGFGKFTLPNVRLFLLDDDGKIAAEQVVFFVSPR
jgi:hypothetical protein